MLYFFRTGRSLLVIALLAAMMAPFAVTANHVPDAPVVLDLAFEGNHGVQWGGATLTGATGLRYNSARVCLDTGVGCPDRVRSVAAGEGLTSTPNPIVSSGEISLSLNRGADQSCPGGSFVEGLTPTGIIACAPATGGDITGVKAGPGLTGGGFSGTVALAVADNGVTSSHIRDGTIGLDDIDADQVQRRVTSQCATGYAMRAILAGTGLLCQAFGPVSRLAADTDDGIGLTGPWTDTFFHEVNIVTLNAPSTGLLLISGTVVVDSNGETGLYGLVADVDGNYAAPDAIVAAAEITSLGSLSYTVSVPVAAGSHTVSQLVAAMTPVSSYDVFSEFLTVQFIAT